MTLKLNLSNKGKAWKLELEPSVLEGKSIGDKLEGKLIKLELEGYEFVITGGSDFAGFPMKEDVEGIGLKKVILTKGWGLHRKPRGEKKKTQKATKGLRLRKTVRGKTISDKSVQININVLKEGSKKLEEIFPDQNKAKEPETPKEESQKVEEKKEQPKAEEPKVEEKAPEKVEKLEDKTEDKPTK
jgi:small subunit ribosomal protein S6e